MNFFLKEDRKEEKSLLKEISLKVFAHDNWKKLQKKVEKKKRKFITEIGFL